MRINTFILMTGFLFAAGSAQAAKICMPCPAGTTSSGGLATSCHAIPNMYRDYFRTVASAKASSCMSGTIDNGIYRVTLGGGNGGSGGHGGAGNRGTWYNNKYMDGLFTNGDGYSGTAGSAGGYLSFQFRIKQDNVKYTLCAGADGKNGGKGSDVSKTCCGTGGSGGGGGSGASSFLKLEIKGESPAFIFAKGGAGGDGGKSGDYECSGNKTGKLGGSGAAGGAIVSDGIAGYEGQLSCAKAGAGGAAGTNGSGTEFSNSFKGKTINDNGNIIDLSKTSANSHADNVPDPENCTSCAKLYKAI
jgi:hypothetical protein